MVVSSAAPAYHVPYRHVSENRQRIVVLFCGSFAIRGRDCSRAPRQNMPVASTVLFFTLATFSGAANVQGRIR